MIITYIFRSVQPVKRQRKPAAPKKKAAVESNPLIEFWYPMSKTPWTTSKRTMRLISATQNHLIGLEILPNNKFRFKKFSQDKAKGMKFVEWNPQSMS